MVSKNIQTPRRFASANPAGGARRIASTASIFLFVQTPSLLHAPHITHPNNGALLTPLTLLLRTFFVGRRMRSISPPGNPTIDPRMCALYPPLVEWRSPQAPSPPIGIRRPTRTSVGPHRLRPPAHWLRKVHVAPSDSRRLGYPAGCVNRIGLEIHCRQHIASPHRRRLAT